MRNHSQHSSRDAQESIESLQRRCSFLVHHPFLAALLSCWFRGFSSWPQ